MTLRFCTWWLFVAVVLQPLSTLAIDILPGELRPFGPGVNLMQISYTHVERSELYKDGRKQPGNPEIDSAVYQIRLGRFFEVANHPAILYAQLPMGYVHPEGSLSAQQGDAGTADPVFMLASWPYANMETKTFLTVGGYFSPATGSYDSRRRFNMGENRTRTALQIGYQAQITDQLNWMGVADVVWYDKNSDYVVRTRFGERQLDLEQDALYSTQVALRYQFNERYALAATYFYTSGGETSLNGVRRDDRVRQSRYQISGFVYMLSGLVALQYGSDFGTENGYLEDNRLVLRYITTF